MAILMNITLDTQLPVTNAYLKVEIMRGNKDRLGFNLTPYLNKTEADNNNPLQEGKYYEFIPDQDNRWDKLAYLYIKTLPEFSTAVDALE